MPRAQRDVEQESQDDYVPAAHAVLAAVPDLLQAAEAAGAVTLAPDVKIGIDRDQGIVRRDGSVWVVTNYTGQLRRSRQAANWGSLAKDGK